MREISGVWLRIAPRPTLIFLLSANIRKEIQKGANDETTKEEPASRT